MAKALVIYGSSTGNTEAAAEMAARGLKAKGLKTEIKDVTQAEPGDLTKDYALILLGSSTWGDEDIELQEDFAEFLENLDGTDLSGKKLAVFGCGDTSYPHFCGAVDAIEEKVRELGGKLTVPGLKIDGDPADIRSEVEEWGEDAAEGLCNTSGA